MNPVVAAKLDALTPDQRRMWDDAGPVMRKTSELHERESAAIAVLLGCTAFLLFALAFAISGEQRPDVALEIPGWAFLVTPICFIALAIFEIYLVDREMGSL